MRFFSALPFIAFFAGAALAAPSTGETDLVERTWGNTWGNSYTTTTTTTKPCRSLNTIVVELHENLKPHCGQLTAITVETANVGQIKPICDKMASLVAGAAAEIKLLKGQQASVILGIEGGAQITTSALAGTLGAMFSLVMSASGAVLAVAGSNFAACQGPLVIIAKAIADLHTSIFSICGLKDLQAAFFANIHAVVPTCYSLGLSPFLNTFGLGINVSGIVGGVCNTISKLIPF